MEKVLQGQWCCGERGHEELGRIDGGVGGRRRRNPFQRLSASTGQGETVHRCYDLAEQGGDLPRDAPLRTLSGANVGGQALFKEQAMVAWYREMKLRPAHLTC